MTQIVVGISELAVAAGQASLVTLGLGSCVAIALHVADQQVGGLAHVLLPHALHTDTPPGKVPALAVPAMVARMRALGASGRIEARLVGGASMFAALLPVGSEGLGVRNVVAARTACHAADVPVVGELTGGETGRSVFFCVQSGRLQVRTVWGDDVVL
ncbi:MAG: chemotaxis protein CheD [Gemmatimonas sp.]|uniref:chemotaxis protein CheD n=1 Tax=Gemmatimonas sp. TaxID=1962908 RepID=UPI00391F7197|nr:chemotaxis protein CheD [Gemmatimonadota bacterium]